MKTLIVFGLFLFAFVTMAQDDGICQPLVEAVIVNTSLECGDTPVGSVCAGNDSAEAITVPNTWAEQFSEAGGTIPNQTLQTLSSTGLDVEAREWGMAFARVPLADADTYATMVFFGALQLDNLGFGVQTFAARITSNTGAFAREAPDINANVAGQLIVGQTIEITGRVEDSTWLRVELPRSEVGWVSVTVLDLLNDDLNLTDLPVVNPNSTSRLFRPFRALNFRSGVGDTPCAAAPESGILIQTPEETDVDLMVNNFSLKIAGTVFLQARREQALTIHVLEGEASTTIDETQYTIPAGDTLDIEETITLDDYDYARMEMLPIELLPRPIVIESDWIQRMFAPSADPLANVTPESPCRIAAPEATNIRVGPGVDYAYRATMQQGWSARPDGRATGSDGAVWWRIEPGSWVSVQVTTSAGNCSIEAVPIITTLPRLSIRD